MKQHLSVICFALTLVLLMGCGFSGASLEKDSFTFFHEDTGICVNTAANPVLTDLGKAHRYSEHPCQITAGMNKTYCYGSFYITTYPKDGEDHIYSIWFADSREKTSEGICIGSTMEQVEAAYGRNCFQGTNACRLLRGDSLLTIIVNENRVSAIQYEAVLT